MGERHWQGSTQGQTVHKQRQRRNEGERERKMERNRKKGKKHAATERKILISDIIYNTSI